MLQGFSCKGQEGFSPPPHQCTIGQIYSGHKGVFRLPLKDQRLAVDGDRLSVGMEQCSEVVQEILSRCMAGGSCSHAQSHTDHQI